MTVSTVLMMAGLLLGKLSSQLREILPANIFGESVADAFFLGFQVPDLFYQLLVGGAIQAAVTPTLARALERNREERAWRSLSVFITVTSILVLTAVGIGILFARPLIDLYYSGPSAIAESAAGMARTLFPQVFFMMLAALAIGVLNAHRRFSATAFGPTVYNLLVILAIITLGGMTAASLIPVGWGITAAAAGFFLLQFFLARREFRFFRPSINIADKGYRRLIRLAVPTLISGSVVQLNVLVFNSFAPASETGWVTALRNSSTTWQLPYGIFAVAIANVMLPSLAGLNAVDNHLGSRRLLSRSLRNALFLIVPFAALFLTMQEDTIRAIFQWSSNYNHGLTERAASLLRWYSLALIPQTIVLLYNQAFYARRITRLALVTSTVSLILNFLLGTLLIRWLDLGMNHLSLAYLISSLINALLLSSLYRRLFPEAAPRGMRRFWLGSAICTIGLILAVLSINLIGYHPSGQLMHLVWYSIRCLAGLAAYFGLAALLGLSEIQAIQAKIDTWLHRSSVDRRG